MFTLQGSDSRLNGTEVFFAEGQYRFQNGDQMLITLLRSNDNWEMIEGDGALKTAAVAVFDQYLMSQH